MKRGKGNILGGIFINYRKLHDNYQHSSDYKFRRTVDLFQQETYRRQRFLTFTLQQVRVQNKDLKMVHCLFLGGRGGGGGGRGGAKQVSHSTEKFESSNSNERF